ncbi:MAG: hypothetical protein M1358_15560 [Chloroflexi bacterium]|nr:hypothetical protein [Chloroflexota bacterium]
MKILSLKVVGSLVTVLLLGTIMATSVMAAPPTPAPRANPNYGYRGFGMMGGYNLRSVAKLLGVTTTDIYSQLEQGKTLVQIASGKATEQQLIDALTAPYADQLKLRVKYEYITQEQADASLAQMIDGVTKWINTPWDSDSGYGSGGCGGSGGFGGMMGGFGSGFSGGPGGFGGMMGRFGTW